MSEPPDFDPDFTDHVHVRLALERADREEWAKFPVRLRLDHLTHRACNQYKSSLSQASLRAARWWFSARRVSPTRAAAPIATREIRASVKRSRRWASACPLTTNNTKRSCSSSENFHPVQKAASASAQATKKYHAEMIKLLRQNEGSFKHVFEQIQKSTIKQRSDSRKSTHCSSPAIPSSGYLFAEDETSSSTRRHKDENHPKVSPKSAQCSKVAQCPLQNNRRTHSGQTCDEQNLTLARLSSILESTTRSGGVKKSPDCHKMCRQTFATKLGEKQVRRESKEEQKVYKSFLTVHLLDANHQVKDLKKSNLGQDVRISLR